MNKSTLGGIVALLIILGGVIFYAAVRPAPAKAPGAAEPTALTGTTYIEHAPYYNIVANYATSTPLQGAAGASATALMKNFVADTIAQFKADGNFANLTKKDIQMMGFDQGRKETLNIVYLIASSPRTVSYIFTIYMDTLGAHGNTLFHTFTFDTTTGESLSIGDLFLPGTDYLGTLSGISRAKLPKIIGEFADTSMIANGTTPEDKNFANFFIDNGVLDILFSPYQVGPYAIGPQTLRISTSELSDTLKAEYR